MTRPTPEVLLVMTNPEVRAGRPTAGQFRPGTPLAPIPLMNPTISTSAATPSPMPEGKSRRSGVRWIGLILGAGILVTLLAVFDVRALLREALALIERLGPWGPILFIAAYVLATVFFMPGSVLTLGAGALFGVVWGSVYVSIGSTLGATCAFLVGRYFARNWVAAKIQGNERFSTIDRAVADEGWRIVGLTRLSPVFPFALLNYAFGLTRVSLKGYVLASWIGMMPGTVMYVYLGSIARAGATGSQRSAAQWALYGLGMAATLAVTVIMTRIARRALAKRSGMLA